MNSGLWRLLASASAVSVVLLAASCTTGHHRAGSTAPPSTSGASARRAVDTGTRADLVVGGLAGTPLVIHVRPGDFTGPGAVTSSPSTGRPVGYPWFTPAGPPRNIAVKGSLAKPLSVSFSAGHAHVGDLPVVWRHDRTLGWYLVAVGDPGGIATAARNRFSPHLPGWVSIKAWVADQAAAVRRWATGRTTPPICSTKPPSWAQVTSPTLDILLSCVGTNTANGDTRAEVQLKNNRGFTQEIAIPPGVQYADAEDQPESVRSLVRTLAGGRDIVLLPPGAQLNVGFSRSAATRDVTFLPIVSGLALATEIMLQLGDLAVERGSRSPVAALVSLTSCTGLLSGSSAGVLSKSLAAIKDIVVGVARCLATEAADKVKAVGLAQQIVAQQTGAPLAVVKSDASFADRVDRWSGKLNLAGKLAKSAKVADLARLAFVVWENVGELLGRSVVGSDPAVVKLHLLGTASSVPSKTAAPGTSDTSAAPAECTDLLKNFNDSLQSLNAVADAQTTGAGTKTANQLELDFKNAFEKADSLRLNLVHNHMICVPPPPRARFRALPEAGRRVIFDASASTGDRLTYHWLTDDLNYPDFINVGTDWLNASSPALSPGGQAPDGTIIDLRHRGNITYRYSVAGDYMPELHVMDVYGRSTFSSVPVRV